MLKAGAFYAHCPVKIHRELCIKFNIGWYGEVLEIFV
jgi:hypothetical protein